MTDTRLEPLIRDLLSWLGQNERPYDEVMAAWRTSCPHLPVWEEANDRGLVQRLNIGGVSLIRLTEAGRAFLTNLR